MRTHLKSVCLVVFLFAVTLSPAAAATVWTDRNADGLPDSGIQNVPAGTIVTLQVWIDSGSFVWTNYLVYVEHASGAFTKRNAGYTIDGANFPIDYFSHPRGFGLGGWGYNNLSGITQIGWMQFKFLGSSAINGKCVSPIINPADSYGVFCQLGTSSTYSLFETASNSCFKSATGGGAKNYSASQSSSWGRVKSLFR